MAFADGYAVQECWSSPVTVDGKWTTPDEAWCTAVEGISLARFGTPQKGLFVFLCDTANAYAPQILVEFADSTNDPGDIIQVCINGGTETSAPTADDFKIEIQGLTTKKVYAGTGTGWAESATALAAVTMAATRTTSAHDPAPHVIAEFIISKATLASWGGNAPPQGLRIACYDASTGVWTSWPPASSADVSSTWGQNSTYTTETPEGLTIGIMLLVSSVAVVVSIRYFRKPPKL